MKKLAFILVLVPLLWGCSKKTVTTVVHSKAVFAEIRPLWANVDIISVPAIDPSTARASVWARNVLHDLTVATARFGKLEFWGGWQDDATGIPCSLVVSTSLGASRGMVVIPRDVTVLSPSQNDTLPWGDVTVVWYCPDQPVWYELNFNYYAYDTSRHHVGAADTQLVSRDTLSVIPAGFLRKFTNAAYVNVFGTVYAHTGPYPGEADNMSGDIRGYLIGTDWGDGVGFYMGSPPLGLGSATPPRITEEKRRESLRKFYGM